MTSEIQIFLFTSQHVKQVIFQHWATSIPTSYPTEPMLYTAAERAVDSGHCLPPQGNMGSVRKYSGAPDESPPFF